MTDNLRKLVRNVRKMQEVWHMSPAAIADEMAKLRADLDLMTARAEAAEHLIKCINAFNSCKKIEVRLIGTKKWHPCDDPAWVFHSHEYRVAVPKIKITRTTKKDDEESK